MSCSAKPDQPCVEDCSGFCHWGCGRPMNMDNWLISIGLTAYRNWADYADRWRQLIAEFEQSNKDRPETSHAPRDSHEPIRTAETDATSAEICRSFSQE